jgi:two-component system phosphate regulon sensor histidine kinase PhoR
MHLHPRFLSILLAVSVSTATTAFLSLLSVNWTVLFVAFSISFSASYLLFYFTLDFIVLREVNEAYSTLEKLKKKEFKLSRKKDIPTLSPIKKLNQELYTYASKKQQEIDQLKRLALYRREFLADVSHELKTPIFAAQGFIHTLLDGAVEDEAIRDKFLRKAARSLDGLNNLVEDLFTLSKMEAGIIVMNRQPFSLDDLFHEVFEQSEDKAEHKNIEIHIPQDQSLWVNADYARIRQALMNLLDNAIKYGNEGGHIRIEVKAVEAQKVEIKISDDGPGIPSEHLDRIFERFYRVEKSRSKSEGGSGLGLAIVKHILEAHHSTIQVSSKLQEGTTFSFFLEKAPIEAAKNHKKPAAAII